MKNLHRISDNFIVLLLLLLTLALFWKINLHSFLLGQQPMWDFDVYYQTADDVIEGADPYTLPYMQTAGPPAVIIPYLPFSIFPLATARSLMISLNMMATLATCWLLVKKIIGRTSLNWTLLLHLLFWISFLPRYNLNVGQPNLMIMLLVTLLLTVKEEKIKGVSLALITLLKTHYVFTWLAFVRSNIRIVLIGVFALLTFLIISLPIIKPDYYDNYLHNRLGNYITTPAPIPDLDYYNQSLRSTLSRLQLDELYPIIGLFLVIGGSLYVLKTGDSASGILLSLLVSPIVWQHYLVVVYPIGILTLYDYWRRGTIPWYATFACGLIIMHLPWLHNQPVELVSGIFASHYYLGVLLLGFSRTRLAHLPLTSAN